MKNKLEQFNQALKKAIGQILIKHYPDQVELIVEDVLIDPSLRSARVWVKANNTQLKLLQKDRTKVQSQLSDYITSRYTPRLMFLRKDQYLEHLDELFAKVEQP